MKDASVVKRYWIIGQVLTCVHSAKSNATHDADTGNSVHCFVKLLYSNMIQLVFV